jgi:hypothetical protein
MMQVKVTIDSDTKITRIETGDGFTTTTVFELNGDTLTAVCRLLCRQSDQFIVIEVSLSESIQAKQNCIWFCKARKLDPSPNASAKMTQQEPGGHTHDHSDRAFDCF